MGHKTLINGTAYDVVSGIALIKGTQRKIIKGKTRINGTVFDISFGGDKLPIGGRIFYIDPASNGATYKFYDAQGKEITNQTVSGLANAAYYSVSGTPTKDKFYAYCTNDGTPTGSILVGSGLQWGGYGTTQGTTADTIGSGKTNSATLVNKLGNTSGTIWYWIKNTLNQALKNGCNDWFIGSKAEMDQLRTSGTSGASAFNNYYLWSSVEYSGNYAYNWDYYFSSWNRYDKNITYQAVALRAF